MRKSKHTTAETLKELSTAFGVTGFEDDIHKIVKGHLSSVCTFETDRMNSIICHHKKTGPKRKNNSRVRKIGIFTHIDEIGFMVRGIMASGFLKFIPLGGWSTQTLPSQRVLIRNTEGRLIHGIIGMKPPHMMSDDERSKTPKIDALYIDIGASSGEEILNKYKIDLGCPVMPFSDFMPLNGEALYSGKAFDNRAGVTSMISIMKGTAGLNKNIDVVGVGSSQEESGLRGAKTSAYKIMPDLAIVIDTPPADDTPNNETAYPAQGKIGCGPQLRLFDPTMIANHRLVDFIKKTAASEKLKLQCAVRSSGGTDAGSVHLALEGVPTVVLGIPVRYIHSHNGLIDVNDIENTVKLVTALVKKLTPEMVDSF